MFKPKQIVTIESLRKVLVKRRDELQLAMNGAFDDLIIEDRHDHADMGASGNGAEIASQLVEAESRELENIEEALERIRDRSYGYCEDCGDAIALARLQALPYANLCIPCQRKAEEENHPRLHILIRGQDDFRDII